MMSLQHRSASFRGTCVVAPCHPKTRLPTTAIERKSFEYPAKDQVDENSEKNSNGYEVVMKTSQGNKKNANYMSAKKKKPVSNSVKRSQSLKIGNSIFDPHNSVDMKNLRHNDDQFFHKLKTLKEENKRALQSLEKLYNFSVDGGRDKCKDLTQKTITTGFSKNLFNGNLISNRKNYLTKNVSRGSSENHSSDFNSDDRELNKKNDIDDINGSISEYLFSETLFNHTNIDDARDPKRENGDPNVDMDTSKDLNATKGIYSSGMHRNQTDFVNGDNTDENADMSKKAWEQKENEKLSDKSSDDELDEQLKVKPPANHTNILPEENESNFRGCSSSYDVIVNMWDNFSVDEVVPYTRISKSVLDESDWSPSITIQEPFKMTLREEKNKKLKETKIERIKDELLQKRLKEEAETKKHIIPTPVPPSTFLPMYSELQAQQQHKKQYTKEISKQLLKSTEKPFSFLKREEEKRKMKCSQSTSVVEKKKKFVKKKAIFKANPFPDKLFDLTLADKQAEQEEYRKIKRKLRSEELLASSSLPPSMKTRNLRYYQAGPKTNQLKAELRKRKEKSFHPTVHHDIPDYEEMQKKIEMAIETRKHLNTPTICEPFNLHTANVPSRRSKFKETTENNKAKIDNIHSLNKVHSSKLVRSNSLGRSNTATRNNTLHRSGSFQFGRSSRSNSESDSPVVYGLTEAARLRHEHIRQSLDKQEEEKTKRDMDSRKKQKDLSKLKKVVAKKATVCDPTRYREKEIAEKLESFRQADQHRNREYKEFLQSIDQKNEQRPLLFERESQTNAKRQAQKRYEDILRNAGIEGEMLHSFCLGSPSSYDFNTYNDEENGKDSNIDSEINNSWDDNAVHSEMSKGYAIVTKHNNVAEGNSNGSDNEVDAENFISDEIEAANSYNDEVESNDGSYIY